MRRNSCISGSEIQEFLRINRYEGVLWFNKESLETLLRGLLAIDLIASLSNPENTATDLNARYLRSYNIIQNINNAAQRSDYKVEKLVEQVKK